MKITSKVVLGLSVAISVLAFSQNCLANNQITERPEKVNFVPDQSSSNHCQQIPPVLEYTYFHDHGSDKRNLSLPSGSKWRWFVIEDSYKIGETTDFIETAVLADDIRHPFHLHGHANDHTSKVSGFYWQWQQDGSRCFGKFDIEDLSGK